MSDTDWLDLEDDFNPLVNDLEDQEHIDRYLTLYVRNDKL